MAYSLLRPVLGRDLGLLLSARAQLIQAKRGVGQQWKDVIGNREVVGFREDTSEALALKEKEKGDWHKLTREDKRTLYRHSFCRTYAEMLVPDGAWKIYLAACLWVSFLATVVLLLEKIYVYPPLPESFLPENMRLALKAHLINRTDEVTGISSKWDYENNCWKKK